MKVNGFLFVIMISYTICMMILYCITNYGNVIAQFKVPEVCNVDREGEVFNVQCYQCICKNSRIECKKQLCPNTDGCFVLQSLKKDECCHKCKGCIKNGVYHESGTEWVEAINPCQLFTCMAGIITESKIQCYVPCTNPLLPIPGQCCPRCPDCPIKGKGKVDGISKSLTDDPCISCNCSSNILTCSKISCPILNCPKSNIVREFNKCCPKCLDFRTLSSSSNSDCLLVSTATVYNTGTNFKLDNCTQCTCDNSTIICRKESCPALNCKHEYQKTLQGHCCAFCISDHLSRQTDHNTEDDEKKLQSERQIYGTCTFFGGSHVRTFDGKVYAFMGTCKYQLLSDCDENSFNVRIKNQMNGTFMSVKRIAFKLSDIRIDLQSNRRIKINDETVDLPYKLKNMFEINGTTEEISVNTKLGMKIYWSYDGLVEVTVPYKYRNRLCGLCGDFNSVKEDDLTTKEGILVEEPTVFAQSWSEGNETCLETKKYGYRGCQPEKHQRLCSYMKGAIFERCLKRINVTPYYESCLKDMCDCPPNDFQCYCESFTRYINDCSIFGISIPNWKRSVGC